MKIFRKRHSRVVTSLLEVVTVGQEVWKLLREEYKGTFSLFTLFWWCLMFPANMWPYVASVVLLHGKFSSLAPLWLPGTELWVTLPVKQGLPLHVPQSSQMCSITGENLGFAILGHHNAVCLFWGAFVPETPAAKKHDTKALPPQLLQIWPF
jgi:hypothetical protein